MLDILLTQSAVEKKNEKIAQNHIAVFSTRNRRFYHIFTCIYTVFAHAKDHILKLRAQAQVLERKTNTGVWIITELTCISVSLTGSKGSKVLIALSPSSF